MGLEHILLGLLEEPASGYDLKRRFDQEVRYFWPAELTQVYSTLRRLEKEGMLRSRIAASTKGPDKRVYSVTPTGQEAFRRWLTGGAEFGNERFGYLAQVYLLSATKDLRRTLGFLSDLQHVFSDRLRTFQQIEAEAMAGKPNAIEAMPPDQLHRYLTLRAGILTMKARRDWCAEAIQIVERRLAGKASADDAKRANKRNTAQSKKGTRP